MPRSASGSTPLTATRARTRRVQINELGPWSADEGHGYDVSNSRRASSSSDDETAADHEEPEEEDEHEEDGEAEGVDASDGEEGQDEEEVGEDDSEAEAAPEFESDGEEPALLSADEEGGESSSHDEDISQQSDSSASSFIPPQTPSTRQNPRRASYSSPSYSSPSWLTERERSRQRSADGWQSRQHGGAHAHGHARAAEEEAWAQPRSLWGQKLNSKGIERLKRASQGPAPVAHTSWIAPRASSTASAAAARRAASSPLRCQPHTGVCEHCWLCMCPPLFAPLSAGDLKQLRSGAQKHAQTDATSSGTSSAAALRTSAAALPTRYYAQPAPAGGADTPGALLADRVAYLPVKLHELLRRHHTRVIDLIRTFDRNLDGVVTQDELARCVHILSILRPLGHQPCLLPPIAIPSHAPLANPEVAGSTLRRALRCLGVKLSHADLRDLYRGLLEFAIDEQGDLALTFRGVQRALGAHPMHVAARVHQKQLARSLAERGFMTREQLEKQVVRLERKVFDDAKKGLATREQVEKARRAAEKQVAKLKRQASGLRDYLEFSEQARERAEARQAELQLENTEIKKQMSAVRREICGGVSPRPLSRGASPRGSFTLSGPPAGRRTSAAATEAATEAAVAVAKAAAVMDAAAAHVKAAVPEEVQVSIV